MKWNRIPAFLLTLLCAFTLAAAEKTVEFDWCTVTIPDKVIPGRNFNVTVVPKAAADGYKVGGDLHHATADSYIGFAAWGGAPKKATAGQPMIFKYKMPKFEDEEQGGQPIFYMTKKGWNEAEKKAYCPVVLPLVEKASATSTATVGSTASAAAPTAGENEKVTEFDWCYVKSPVKVEPGKNFTVTITPKKGNEGLKIGGDLHNATASSYIGFAAWGGAPKKVRDLSPLSFTYKMPPYQSADRGVQVIFYLTEKGWDQATEKAYVPVILPQVTEQILKTVRPATATLKKSWMRYGKITGPDGKDPVWKSGEKILVNLDYYVDPSDDWGKTKVAMWAVGPWVDNPDGKYSTKREHKQYACWPPEKTCKIGEESTLQWELTLPKAYSSRTPEEGKYGDSLLLICFFKGADGKPWPGQSRQGLPQFVRNDGYFEVDAPTPGNLFTYNEPVVMEVEPSAKGKSMKPETLKWNVTDVDGKQVASGSVSFPNADGSVTKIPMEIKNKGTFLFRAELPGKDAREVTFARIPDVSKIVGDKPTRFGGQNFFGNSEGVEVARRMGLSTCRVWLSWAGLEPKRGQYNEPAWDNLRKNIAVLREHKIRPILMVNGIPAWAIDNPNCYGAEFSALPVFDADIEKFVTRLAKEFKDDAIGFEWQNEIVPGSACKDPVAEYVRMCRVADAASKKVNPKFRNQIAGGLWPQTFRQSLIAAGIMEFTDILPIHYGNAVSVAGARRDLASVGAQDRVAVWDNETAYGTSTWGMPLSVAMTEKGQSDYYFTRLPDELQAGCEHIMLFAGGGEAAGNWSHFWGDMSPRPAAAALSVLIHALADSNAIGTFSLGKNDSIKLFERPNRPPVMVVSSIEKDGETVAIPVGAKPIVKIDQQGNETKISDGGICSVKLTESPYLLEGGDANTLKANLVMSFPGSATFVPTYTVIAGNTLDIPVRFTNLLDHEISLTLTPDAATIPGKAAAITVKNLAPGKSVTELLKVAGVRKGIAHSSVTMAFTDATLPKITRRFVVNAVNPDEIGNLAQNPGFEVSGDSDDAAANWNNSGNHGARIEFKDADDLGHGKFAYRFENTNKQYHNISQGIGKLPTVGGDYVYSFWIKADKLQTGSNMGGSTESGEDWNRHWLHVFQAPQTQPDWQVFRKRVTLPPGTTSLNMTPVCNGEGWSMIDNVQLVPYEGTEFAAFAPKASGKIKIDGDISEFNRSEPIPLIGANQLKTIDKNYQWSPKNMSAVAYFNYDKDYLYAAIEVVDDVHVANKTEANCKQDDSVRIALHPMNRIPGEDSKAFCFDLSSVAPGGSGKHTIYRPAEFSGGLKSGSLAKDSSVYDIAIVRKGNHTIYEIAMPWSDLGGLSGVIGTRMGLSLQVTDNDGKGPAAKMLWGEGIDPWGPVSFGMLTLVK